MGSAFQIITAPRERQKEALTLLFASLPPAEQSAQLSLTTAALARGRLSLDGLMIATPQPPDAGETLLGAVWGSQLGGSSALMWPPQLAAAAPPGVALGLLAAAECWLSQRGADFAMAYLSDSRSTAAQYLLAAGYKEVSRLLYVVSEQADFPHAEPSPHLEFVPIDCVAPARLTRLIEQTYVDSRDCRQLEGDRTIDQVLDGYRHTGEFSPSRWLIARHAGQDVGCVLLADHPGDDQWELIYTGVAAAHRGQGFGLDITRHAQWLVRRAGRARLVLGVDADNAPAIRMYSAAGFRTWDERHVFARQINASAAANRRADAGD